MAVVVFYVVGAIVTFAVCWAIVAAIPPSAPKLLTGAVVTAAGASPVVLPALVWIHLAQRAELLGTYDPKLPLILVTFAPLLAASGLGAWMGWLRRKRRVTGPG